MLLMIDNFDSFTYNVVHGFQVLGAKVKVVRSNALSVEECLALKPSKIVIGPGPGNPTQSGISNALIHQVKGKIPLLGICLGMQCLAEVFGGNVIRAKAPMHGKTSAIHHDGKTLFSGLTQGFFATRYHSLVVDSETLPISLVVSAKTADGEIMALRHRNYPLEGVQFHPESILTPEGQRLLKNFIEQPLAVKLV